MNWNSFYYQKLPSWDIGRPQPAFALFHVFSEQERACYMAALTRCGHCEHRNSR